MANNIFQQKVTPVVPRALASERIFVYVPQATVEKAGIASYDANDFNVNNQGKVSIKWPYAHTGVFGLVKVAPASAGYLNFTNDSNHYLQVDETKLNQKISTDIHNHNISESAHPYIQQKITVINTKIGDMSQLVTEDKSNLVTAINEAYNHGGGGSEEVIDEKIGEHNSSEQAHPYIQGRINTLQTTVSGMQTTISGIETNLGNKVDKQNGNYFVYNDNTNGTKLGYETGTFGSGNSNTVEAFNNKLELESTQFSSGSVGGTNSVKITLSPAHAKLYKETYSFEGEIIIKEGDIAITQDIEDALAPIEVLIPDQASSTNKLADKAFVNSTVQTATANFRGNWENWASVPIDPTEYPADYTGTTTPSTNDYMVVQDASGYIDPQQTLVGTWRFKYTGVWATDGRNGWRPEYQVNETPLTAAQLAALNSGATAALINQISLNEQHIADISGNLSSNYYTKTSVDGLVDAKLSKQASAGGKITTINNTGSYIEIQFTENGVVDRTVTIDETGLEFIDNDSGEDYRPTINSTEEMAYLSDLPQMIFPNEEEEV